ncbi:MAG TPA: hypothetical protein VFG76_13160, partial [Candidatus Polarisedimenticolia bacterium]|nr:hypothetical protein [Candidatus Polarisedimenticolia bacterium]
MSRRRIAVICEVMHAPYDEGIRLYAAGLARALARECDLTLASEKDSQLDGILVSGVLTDRYFLRRRLADLLHGARPEGIIYVPWTSLTARTILRVRSLRRYARQARIAVAALQPRRIDLGMRIMSKLRGPDLVVATGPGTLAQATRLSLPVVRLWPGVDTCRFRPSQPGERRAARLAAGMDPNAYVVLHVGHLKEARNVDAL